MLFCCYDIFDRVVKEAYNDDTEYYYFYDTEGNLSRQCCVEKGNVTAVYVFEYDSLGRLIRSKQTSDGTLREDDGTVDEGTTVQRTEHLYDNENRITSQSWQLGTRTYSESYTYNDNVSTNTGPIKDGSVATMTITPLNKTLSFSYDSLKHLDKVTVPGVYAREYDYKALTSKQSSNQVETLSYTLGSSTTPGLYYDYTYDSAGNITEIKQNGSQIAEYKYDEQGQLLKETRGGKVYWYIYDTAGNILRIDASGTSNYKSFTYGIGAWRDLLSSVRIGGTTKTISYDDNGNPINWYNGNILTNFVWSKGRQLTKLNKNSTVIQYAYDMSGIRSSKKVGSDTYNFITQNGQVVRQTWGSKVLDIVYDNNGQPFAMCYSTNSGSTFTNYYYITNAQGDVVRIVNSAGAAVANYTYDAWGKVLTATGTMASINPIRYRGYYYDTETGWYYVSSRYYDPEIGRFINADDVTMLGANGDSASLNLFAYCGNNPVIREDKGGAIWNVLIGAGVGALVSGIVSVASQAIENKGFSNIDWRRVAVSAAAGAISGGFAATGVKVKGQMVVNGVIGAVSAGIDTYLSDNNASFFDYAKNIAVGAGLGVIGGRIGGDGTGTKHLTNSACRAIKRGVQAGKNILKTGFKKSMQGIYKAGKYYFSQITTEAIKSGKKAVIPIITSNIPSATYNIVGAYRRA